MTREQEVKVRDCGCPVSPESYEKDAKTINLALQGGGSHGAFTWGVMDRLLEDGRIKVEGLCATSAGSMNAVVFAYGNMMGGRGGARAALYHFWKDISRAGAFLNPMGYMPWKHFTDQWKFFTSPWNVDYSPVFLMTEFVTRMLSPYQFNPFDFNPLREVVEKSVEFDTLRKCQETKLFISATKVRTGKVKVFVTEEITSDVILASACLPHLFQAVEIGGEYYWDGGYMGNPALFPVFYHTDSRDLMIVHINPLIRETLPKSSDEIMDRLNEISFNSSLLKEMRAIAFVTKLIEEDWLKDEYKTRLKHLLVHSVRADEALRDLNVSSKSNTDWEFLLYLRDQGRETADLWLSKNFESIGRESTVDLKAEFLDLGANHIG